MQITLMRETPRLVAVVLVCGLAQAAAVGYYRFEEGPAGTVPTGPNAITDSSGAGAHGTPAGSPVYSTDIPVGSVPRTGAPNLFSLAFDGSAQVSFSNLFQFHQSGDATLEFWIKFETMDHQSVFWTRLDGTDADRFNIFTNFTSPNSFNIDPRVSTPGIFNPAVPITPNVWTHLAVVRVGNTDYFVYKDGALFGQAVNNTALPGAIGWTISGRPGFRYVGLLDEVRISDAASDPSDFLIHPVPEPSHLGLLSMLPFIVGYFRAHRGKRG